MKTLKRGSDQTGRGALGSLGRPSAARRAEHQRFWTAIAAGRASEGAAVEAGVSPSVGDPQWWSRVPRHRAVARRSSWPPPEAGEAPISLRMSGRLTVFQRPAPSGRPSYGSFARRVRTAETAPQACGPPESMRRSAPGIRKGAAVSFSASVDSITTGVRYACYYGPNVTHAYLNLARHYGTTILPTRTAAPGDKAKVERPIFYVRDIFVYGRVFLDNGNLDEQRSRWLEKANRRIHGTTRERPILRFEQERSLLRPACLSAVPVARPSADSRDQAAEAASHPSPDHNRAMSARFVLRARGRYPMKTAPISVHGGPCSASSRCPALWRLSTTSSTAWTEAP